VVKVVQRHTDEANHVWEQKEKLEQSLQVQTTEYLEGRHTHKLNIMSAGIEGTHQ